jgi:hypothetical protein
VYSSFLAWGRKKRLLGATLDTVKVVIHVEKTDSECEGGDDDTVHLARGEGVGRNHDNEQNLNDSQLGESGHGEARLGGRDHLSGLGLGIHRPGVVRHFYYLLRK